MKGIIITQEIKDKNDYVRNRDVGSFYSGSLPNKFWGVERIIGGYPQRTDLHKADGWYDIVTPTTLDTEKLGDRYFDATNEVFTYYVIPKTQAELDADAEAELNSDVSQQAIDQRRADGTVGFDRIKAIIERKYRNGEITANQAKSADAYFHELIKDLNFGSWIIVKGLLDAEAATVPAGYQSLFDTIKNKVDTYVQNNY